MIPLIIYFRIVKMANNRILGYYDNNIFILGDSIK